MTDIRTVSLSGSELAVTDIGGTNICIKNYGSGTLYASVRPGVTAGAPGVLPVDSGSSVVLPDCKGAVYLLGSGKVVLAGGDTKVNLFSPDSGSSGGSGGSTEPEGSGLIRCEFWYTGGNKMTIDVSEAKYFGIRPNSGVGAEVSMLNGDTYQNEELIYVTSNNGCYIREAPASGKIFVQAGNFVLYTSDSYAAIERACVAHLEGWTCIDRRDS